MGELLSKSMAEKSSLSMFSHATGASMMQTSFNAKEESNKVIQSTTKPEETRKRPVVFFMHIYLLIDIALKVIRSLAHTTCLFIIHNINSKSLEIKAFLSGYITPLFASRDEHCDIKFPSHIWMQTEFHTMIHYSKQSVSNACGCGSGFPASLLLPKVYLGYICVDNGGVHRETRQ